MIEDMEVEYLERIGTSHACDLWLVRDGGELAIARVYSDRGDTTFDDIVAGCERWVGVEHAHLVPIRAIARDGARTLAIITGDDRGPGFLPMATALTDLDERVAWSAGEIAGIGEALAALRFRDRAFVHRDANTTQLIVGADGHARLRPLVSEDARRGAAWTGRATVIKPWRWMSPEQCKGYELQPASDVFTLALTLYVAITQKNPYRRETSFETLQAMSDAAPPEPPSCTAALADLVLRNLSRSREERDAHPGAFAARLRAIVGKTPAEVCAKVAAARPDTKPAPNHSPAITGVRCAKQWHELTPTTAADIRYCGDCKQDVVQVRSLGAIIPLLGKRCISYRPE